MPPKHDVNEVQRWEKFVSTPSSTDDRSRETRRDRAGEVFDSLESYAAGSASTGASTSSGHNHTTSKQTPDWIAILHDNSAD